MFWQISSLIRKFCSALNKGKMELLLIPNNTKGMVMILLIPNNTKSVVILGWPLNRIFRTQEVCLELGGLKLYEFNRVGVSYKPQNTIQYLDIICASGSKFTFYIKLKQGLDVSKSLQKKKAVDCFWRIFFLTILVVLAQEKSRLQYFPEAGTLRKGSAHQVSTNTPSPHHPRPCPGTSSISQISPHFHLQYFSSASSKQLSVQSHNHLKYCQFSRSSAKNLGFIAVA